MKRISTAWLLLLAFLPARADAQLFDVRRMAMGGVILGGRQGGEGANVAYRALPKPKRGLRHVSLPIGVIPVLQDPPSFDARNPEFNVFEIANLVENPPWNLQLTQPSTPSNDIALEVTRTSLTMDLGDLGKVFPAGHVRAYGCTNGPSVGLSLGRLFVAAAPLVEYRNDLDLNDELSDVLRNSHALAPNSHYAITDQAQAQAAAALHVGAALPIWRSGDAKDPASAIYGGTRVKLLRGLAYGEARNVAAYDTGDTLFGTNGLDLQYGGHFLDAMPKDGGWGYGIDAGAVWKQGPLEFGLAVDDLSTRIGWKLRETVATRDSVTGDIQQRTVREGIPFTSEIPAATVANIAFVGGRWMVAADLRHNVLATTAHAGIERWLGPVVLRAGGGIDSDRRSQFSGGFGIALGRIALDAAVATHNRNLENQRSVELGVGFEVLN